MKTTLKIFKTGLIIFALAMTSCSKDGEVGPIGAAGVDGTNGTNGINGADGNANVIASGWFPLSFTKTVTNGIAKFDSTILVPEITTEIVDSGVVLVYGKLNGYTQQVWPTDHVAKFPITVIYNVLGNIQINTFKAFITEGNITVNITENFDIHDGIGPAHRFRYVVIPSNSTTGKSSHLDYSKMTYEEVVDFFKLEY